RARSAARGSVDVGVVRRPCHGARHVAGSRRRTAQIEVVVRRAGRRILDGVQIRARVRRAGIRLRRALHVVALIDESGPDDCRPVREQWYATDLEVPVKDIVVDVARTTRGFAGDLPGARETVEPDDVVRLDAAGLAAGELERSAAVTRVEVVVL